MFERGVSAFQIDDPLLRWVFAPGSSFQDPVRPLQAEHTRPREQSSLRRNVPVKNRSRSLLSKTTPAYVL
jgi:hypothetical protein